MALSLTHLDESQRQAVLFERGPLLVLAGAGSGKTRVLTHRIAHLVLERGVRPEQILAVSFTNKAAEEMGERMVPLIGAKNAKALWLSTFHSFGVRFAREEAKAMFGEAGRFSIFDQGDAVGLVREIVRREGIGDRKLDLWSVQGRISLWKNKMIAPGQVRVNEAVEYDQVAAECFGHYETSLRSMRALDFDDLVGKPAALLTHDAAVRERWQQRFRFLLIDEFQDTNTAQMALVKGLIGPERNVMVVGDDDQSIYGWRGAEVENILDFDKTFPGTTTIKIVRNYRSIPEVLTIANVAMKSATKRLDKSLVATRKSGDKVRMVTLGTPEQEAKFVAGEIRTLYKDGRKLGDMAVLYRSNLQARLIEEELRVEGLPYRLVGGTQFFEKKEVKDAIAYLRIAVNPKDELSLRRILNYPSRGIGDVAVQRLEQYGLARGRSFVTSVMQADGIDGLSDVAKAGCAKVRRAIEQMREQLETPHLSRASLDYFDAVGLRADLEGGAARDGASIADKQRWLNVEHMLKGLDRWEAKDEEDRPSLATFLQRLTVRREEEGEPAPGNEVTLSSLHGSKGLEWPVVFLIGINEGTLPHMRTIDPKASEAAPTDVDEERRLFYVGVTRARDRLYLSRFMRREVRGKELPTTPSRFLTGLPEDILEVVTRDDASPLALEDNTHSAAAFLAMLKSR
jgi:DNA helicase-2/ATP-dependent DNA helicase PcrA